MSRIRRWPAGGLRRLLSGCALSSLAALLLRAHPLAAAEPSRTVAPVPGFELIALGTEGGLHDGDLSAWLLRAPGDRHYLGLDAGTVLPGIAAALRRHAFDDFPLPARTGWTRQGWLFREGISGWFVSHPHLDHVAGLLVASTDDLPKPIYGLPVTLDALSRDYFNWSAWPNFADRGAPPALGRYALQSHPAGQRFAVAGTRLQGRIFDLQHDRMRSSMLLLQENEAWFAYFGDTGPDRPQASHCLADSWSVLAPLIRRHRLAGMVIEVSYPDGVDDAHLYGHLTPAWLLAELHRLAAAVGGPRPLAGLAVVIGHIKPSLRAGPSAREVIRRELRQGNDLGVRFLLPQQGQRLWLALPHASRPI